MLRFPLRPDFSQQAIEPVRIQAKCPFCREYSTLNPTAINDLLVAPIDMILGLRQCANPECSSALYFARYATGQVVIVPPSEMDFDDSGVPDSVTSIFKEAISCHSNGCYTASAIMIRRTLEQLCDEQHCEGRDLLVRITDLKTKVVLPEELFEAMNSLRLLGNDAAHVRSKNFESIGVNEVTVSLELTKEILKATYQYKNLLSKLIGFRK